MSLVVELPAEFGEELEAEAGKAGLSLQEHATLLLYIAAAALKESGPWVDPANAASWDAARHEEEARRFESSVVESLAGHGFKHAEDEAKLRRLASRFYRGLWSWRKDFVEKTSSGAPHASTGDRGPQEAGAPSRRPSALGKYAHVPGSSEDFARAKDAEIDLEDRRGR